MQIPERYIPSQYICRASEAKKIFSVKDQNPVEIASKIALAELGQIIFFITQTILYSLAFAGILSPMITGIISFILIPAETLCSYNTFVHFKPFSRMILTAATIITLTICAACAIFGIVRDSAITLCIGGIALHLFRNLSECIDARNSQKSAHYRDQILNVN